ATLSIRDLPSGVSASFNPQTITFRNGTSFSERTLLTLTADSQFPQFFGTRSCTISVSRDNIPATTIPLGITWSRGEITSVDVTYLNTCHCAPMLMRGGVSVTVRGRGFCSGSVVEFGNTGGVATPTFISSDGTQLRVDVPRLATSGQ